MSEIYVIKMVCEDTPDIIIAGIATSQEKADAMLRKLEAEDDSWEYSVSKYMTDCIILNGEKICF